MQVEADPEERLASLAEWVASPDSKIWEEVVVVDNREEARVVGEVRPSLLGKCDEGFSLHQ